MLGVCYYPEHWPEDRWATDAAMMAELGLTWVRIGEFAWSRLQPTPGDLRLDWLHRSVDLLREHGLKVVLGTPTATPPRWMVDRHPDMLAVDANGNTRRFGSRRHYTFSHAGYRKECARITEILAREFGAKVQAWQTDNEYGCHDTTLSYSEVDRLAFHDWLRERYETIEALNAAWGTVFWSMEYGTFEQIGLPNLTVTEPSPAHAMDYRRFASDQVVAFNRIQTDIIRQHSDAPISHNYMGRVTEFDHFAVGADCDLATWDSYPIGFLEDRVSANPTHRAAHARQGDPDFQAFHHDLYRAVGRGRWWVMEQQPGPVNWAPVNPAPLPGMVRAWTWEAIAHGAEVVSYFRWRQLPFGQEQNHAGLLRSDGSKSAAWDEVAAVAAELQDVSWAQCETEPARVGLVFSYPSEWAFKVQPQGVGFTHFDAAMTLYRSLRRAGIDVDILPPDTTDFGARDLVLIPALHAWTPELLDAVERFDGLLLVGPRTGLRDRDFRLRMHPLPGVSVESVETFHDTRPVQGGGAFRLWREHVATAHAVTLECDDGWPAMVRDRNRHYLCGWPDDALADRIVATLAEAAGIHTEVMPTSVRRRDRGPMSIYVNYGATAVTLHGEALEPAGVKIVNRFIEKR